MGNGIHIRSQRAVRDYSKSKDYGKVDLTKGTYLTISTFPGDEGQPIVNIRKWIRSEREGGYSGPTKEGIVLSKAKLKELTAILLTVQGAEQ